MEKLKISNGGATNDRPVDNVFTGRLPVSAGPQHHWQQHHQQLLMQADEST